LLLGEQAILTALGDPARLRDRVSASRRVGERLPMGVLPDAARGEYAHLRLCRGRWCSRRRSAPGSRYDGASTASTWWPCEDARSEAMTDARRKASLVALGALGLGVAFWLFRPAPLTVDVAMARRGRAARDDRRGGRDARAPALHGRCAHDGTPAAHRGRRGTVRRSGRRPGADRAGTARSRATRDGTRAPRSGRGDPARGRRGTGVARRPRSPRRSATRRRRRTAPPRRHALPPTRARRRSSPRPAPRRKPRRRASPPRPRPTTSSRARSAVVDEALNPPEQAAPGGACGNGRPCVVARAPVAGQVLRVFEEKRAHRRGRHATRRDRRSRVARDRGGHPLHRRGARDSPRALPRRRLAAARGPSKAACGRSSRRPSRKISALGVERAARQRDRGPPRARGALGDRFRVEARS